MRAKEKQDQDMKDVNQDETQAREREADTTITELVKQDPNTPKTAHRGASQTSPGIRHKPSFKANPTVELEGVGSERTQMTMTTNPYIV